MSTSSSDTQNTVVPVDIRTSQDTILTVKEDTATNDVGEYIGQCKWFNDKLGYGFVTICNGADKGKDIFVHHTGVKPLNSSYKTLRKGEYIQFDVMEGQNGLQAINVRGIGGGPLMCDFVTSKNIPGDMGEFDVPHTVPHVPQVWHTVHHKKPSKFPTGRKTRPYVAK